MAATFKVQTWDNTGWGWDQATAGSPCEQLCSELRSWITTINGNASQTGKQVALVRDETSSTTANYRGLTIDMPAHTTTGSLYFQMASISATILQMYAGDTYTNDTTNGGYGVVSGGVSDTNVSWKNSITSTAQICAAYGVVDGEEFFSCGWLLDNSTSYADHFTLLKDHNGEWAVIFNDGTSTIGITWDPLRTTPDWIGISGDTYAGNSSYVTTACFYLNAAGLSTGDPCTAYMYPASNDIVNYPTDVNALTYFPDGATGDYFAKISYYGPYFRYTPV